MKDDKFLKNAAFIFYNSVYAYLVNNCTVNWVAKKYLFLDFYTWYTIIQSKLDIKLSTINSLNAHSIDAGYKNGFFSTAIITASLPRFTMLEVVYKF